MSKVVKQHLFVSHRTINIGSTTGHSILFEKGVPTHVPRVMHAEVMEKGILPCDAKGETLDTEKMDDIVPELKVLVEPESPFEREAAILGVLEKIVKRNNAQDFTAGGVPNHGVVSASLGWRVDSREIRPVWNKLKSDAAQVK